MLLSSSSSTSDSRWICGSVVNTIDTSALPEVSTSWRCGIGTVMKRLKRSPYTRSRPLRQSKRIAALGRARQRQLAGLALEVGDLAQVELLGGLLADRDLVAGGERRRRERDQAVGREAALGLLVGLIGVLRQLAGRSCRRTTAAPCRCTRGRRRSPRTRRRAGRRARRRGPGSCRTWKPAARRPCAKISPSTRCSVKFFEPIVSDTRAFASSRRIVWRRRRGRRGARRRRATRRRRSRSPPARPSASAASSAASRERFMAESVSAGVRPRRAARRGVGGVLERVVERRERVRGQPERGRGQPVGEPGVLGQQRAVEVRADHGAVRAAADALVAAAAVVAVALEHPPERRRARSEPRAAAVVLEAGQHRGSAGDLDRDVADQPRAVLADGLEVDEADAGQPLVAELVAVAEQLVAAADAEDHRAALRGGVQRVALDGGEVLRAQRLVAVLAAAEVEEVVGVGVELLAEPRARQLEADPAPRAAPLEQQQVAAVGVDVHQVRVQRADPQRRSATEHHHRGADVLVGRRDHAAAPRPAGRGRRPREPRPRR